MRAEREVANLDVELPNVQFADAEYAKLLEESLEDLDVSLVRSEDEGPEPDASLTAADAADWMAETVHCQGTLDQTDAAWHVRWHFGRRFIYANENGNYAIDREVLHEFRARTIKTVVWVRNERTWRLRRADDPRETRMVTD